METKSGNRAYRLVKWLWLILQATTLPLAILFLAHKKIVFFEGRLAMYLFILAGVAFLILWLIGHSLLTMHRYPLDLPGSLTMMAGFLGQQVLILVTGGSILLAVFTAFYSTLAALAVCFLLLGAIAIKKKKIQGPLIFALLIPIPFIAFWLYHFGRPLWLELARLKPLGRIADLLAMVFAVWSLARNLQSFTIYSDTPDPALQEKFDKEWESWAPPTIIILILSVVASILLFGIFRPK